MGCCSSSSKTTPQKIGEEGDAAMPMKGDMARGVTPNVGASRTSTPQDVELTASGKFRHANLVMNNHAGDPNAANLTPQNRFGHGGGFDDGPDRSDFIEPMKNDADKKTAVRMFIPWEQPVLGGKENKRPKFSSEGRAKRSKSVTTDLHTKGRQTQQQVFIPGSGNEQMLMAGSKKKMSVLGAKLAPLKGVTARDETKDEMAEGRKKAKEAKAKVREIQKVLTECGLDKATICLIKEYADVGKRREDIIVVAAKNPQERLLRSQSLHSRTIVKMPIEG